MASRTVPAAIREALVEALRLDAAEVDQAITWARRAGYSTDEVPGRLIEAAAAVPDRGKRGPKATNKLRSAIFDGAPCSIGEKSAAVFFRELRHARAAGIDDPTLFTRRKPRSASEVARECEDWLRKNGRLNGQQGFRGDGWGFDAPQGG